MLGKERTKELTLKYLECSCGLRHSGFGFGANSGLDDGPPKVNPVAPASRLGRDSGSSRASSGVGPARKIMSLSKRLKGSRSTDSLQTGTPSYGAGFCSADTLASRECLRRRKVNLMETSKLKIITFGLKHRLTQKRPQTAGLKKQTNSDSHEKTRTQTIMRTQKQATQNNFGLNFRLRGCGEGKGAMQKPRGKTKQTTYIEQNRSKR